MAELAGMAALVRELRDLAGQARGELVDPALLDALDVRHIDLACARADAIRVVLFGEFKAGKSTLVNALLGTQASGVDFLEKTAAVLRFFPSDEVVVAVHLADGSVTIDRPGRFDDTMLDALVASHGPERIRRIDVGLPIGPGPVLVDTPGIGGRTAPNQVLALEGVREADIVLFCIGADAVGGSRDTGSARDLARGKTPLLVVLTRADLLDGPAEVEDVRRWLANAIEVPPERVLAVGGFGAGGTPTGLEALRRALAALTADGLAVRQAAEAARAARSAASLAAVVERCEGRLAAWTDAADRARATAEAVASAVELRVRNRVLEDVEARLFAPEVGRVVTSLAGAVESAHATPATSPDEVGRAWTAIAGSVPDLVLEEWRGRAEVLRTQLEELCTAVRSAAAGVLAERFRPEEVAALVEQRSRAAAQTGLGVTTAAAVGSAGLSTLAGGSLGAAVTGVGLPVAAIGAALSLVWGRFVARRERAKAAAEVRRQIDAMKDEFRTEILEAHVFPQIRGINRKVVEHLLDEVVARVSPFATRSDLDRARDRLARVRDRVPAS